MSVPFTVPSGTFLEYFPSKCLPRNPNAYPVMAWCHDIDLHFDNEVRLIFQRKRGRGKRISGNDLLQMLGGWEPDTSFSLYL